MLSTLFGNSSVPLLEQVVHFTEARHGVLAGNIANLDTPGYKTRDLSPELFQEKLKEAVDARHAPPAQTYSYGNYGNYGNTINGSSINGSSTNGNSGTFPAQQTENSVSRVDRNLAAFEDVKNSYKAILRHDGVDVSMENQINEIVKNQTEHNLAAGILSSQFRLLRAAISERVA